MSIDYRVINGLGCLGAAIHRLVKWGAGMYVRNPEGRKVREVVTRPYSAQTAFDRSPPESLEVQGFLPWVTEVLQVSYGITPTGTPEEVPNSPEGCAVYALANRLGSPFMYVGYTEDEERLGDCEAYLNSVLLTQRTATVALLTDGDTHVLIRRRHDADRCEHIPDLPGSDTLGNQGDLFSVEAVKRGPSAAEIGSALFRAHSTIRDIDGLHSDEALDELCKVIAIGLSGNQGPESPQFEAASQNQIVLASEVRAAYSSLLQDPPDRRWGDIFEAPVRLSDACLTRVWTTITQAGILDASTDLKGQAFQRVLDPAIRAGMGQFFTPSPVIDFMVDATGPRQGERIIDPFCGSGHFLRRAIDAAQLAGGADTAQSIRDWVSRDVHGIERSARMLRLARTDMLLHDGLAVALHHKDALAPLSVLEPLEASSFDLVLTNPPFGSLLGQDALSGLGTFELAGAGGRLPVEILGLERSVQLLRPGGRLGIVLPEGVLTNQRLRHVRQWLQRHMMVIALVALPVETFAPFGANVRTSVIFAIKLGERKRPRGGTVLLARSEQVGYDASGRPTSVDSDLSKIAELVNSAFLRAGSR